MKANRGQTSNDVIPAALHVAAAEEVQGRLLPAMARTLNSKRTRIETM